jgi:hypothetical protein
MQNDMVFNFQQHGAGKAVNWRVAPSITTERWYVYYYELNLFGDSRSLRQVLVSTNGYRKITWQIIDPFISNKDDELEVKMLLMSIDLKLRANSVLELQYC